MFLNNYRKTMFAKINISNSFDYARTGFFQLMFVSFINFGLILISNRYYKKGEKITWELKKERKYRKKTLEIFLIL